MDTETLAPGNSSFSEPQEMEDLENLEFETFWEWDFDVQVALLTTLLVGAVLLFRVLNNWRRVLEARREAERAERNETPEQAELRRENAQRRINQAMEQPVHECPICLLTPANYPVLTDCGHIFCCECIIQYWQTSKAIFTPCDCAICRSTIFQFHMLLPVRWPVQNAENDDEIHENNMRIDDYNRRFSTNRPFLDYLRDIPVLVPYLFRNFLQRDLFDIVYQVRIGVVFLLLFIYLLVPTDMLPESVYGVLGFMDDIVLAVVVIGGLIRWLRNYMAERGLARQD